MSDSIISYDISVSPSPTPIDLTAAIVKNELQVTVTSVPRITFLLTPEGDILQKILSAVVWPIASLIALLAKDAPMDLLQGKVVPISSIPDYTTDSVTIAPGNVALGGATAGGMNLLKVTAALTVSVASSVKAPSTSGSLES